jgi:hypothetical protein
MCSLDLNTRPEQRPIRKASARFSASRSGNVIVTIFTRAFLANSSLAIRTPRFAGCFGGQGS